MILNSNIKYELKVKYCENNKTEITDLSKINNLKSECDISNCLFKNDKIEFNSQNISTYWNLDKEYWGEEFVNFINKNIILTDNNSKDILENNIDVWNCLINDDNLSKEAFDIIIDFVNEKTDKLNSKLIEYKVCKIIDKDLLNISDENLQILLSNKYKEATTELFKKDGINIIDIDDLMEHTLKYNKIPIDTKINLIVTKIRNHTESSKIQKYIQLINEISKLSNIFNNGRLSIKNIDDYNKRIVDALVEYEYAKITKNDNLVLNKNIKL